DDNHRRPVALAAEEEHEPSGLERLRKPLRIVDADVIGEVDADETEEGEGDRGRDLEWRAKLTRGEPDVEGADEQRGEGEQTPGDDVVADGTGERRNQVEGERRI